ncbi:MAG: AbrB/MazE/SpoVT family DNA-binding domain-containing protein [Eubacteriales bacterium]|nr:AbrB/MazE/SpoVT family DNA-binding domain-containing protein [Eubacteriales bacterium]
MEGPKGKHLFGTVRVGEKGQIVIPKGARSIFDIQPGDSLVVLGDEATGLALMKNDAFLALISDAIFMQKQSPDMPEGKPPLTGEEAFEEIKNLAQKRADE